MVGVMVRVGVIVGVGVGVGDGQSRVLRIHSTQSV
jgi:hypothetical protein